MPSPRRARGRSDWCAVAAGACAIALGACATRPVVEIVSLSPTTISPDRDGRDDVARLTYRIGRRAHLEVTLTGEDGTAHVLRSDSLRQPDSEPYELLFGGVIDGRMLPDGTYHVALVATPTGGGSPVTVRAPDLRIVDADAHPPQLRGLTVLPARFTPNQDGLDDRVAISYSLDEPAEVRLRIETADGAYVTDVLADTHTNNSPGDPGPHVYDYDAGVDADAPPPPDGRYVVVVEARDAAGNVTIERRPLEIAEGGQPRAAFIDDVQWSATRLPLGATLVFTATVKNVGGTPIRTRGPAPGFVYDNNATFNQLAPRAFVLLARSSGRRGAVRVTAPAAGGSVEAPIRLTTDAPVVDPAIDGAASDVGGGARSPQGAPTLPAEATPAGAPMQICGAVTGPDGAAAASAEVFAFEADGDNGRRAVADRQGRYCFDGLVVSPDYERTFARSPGALRVGFTYDDRRSDLDYPFRFQVGATAALDACPSGDQELWYLCLMPGATVRVQGAVRFVEAPYRRLTNAYLALLHEDVRVMHGPYGVQALAIEYDTPRAR